VLEQVFEQVAGPQATMLTRGAWLRERRLVAIDGFEVDVPDTDKNVAEFGYAGSGANRSAFPKARVVALAECGTHAFLAAEVGAYAVGEKTLAKGLYGRLRRDELLVADRNFYSFEAWDLATRSGAALLWRAPTQLALPVIKVLSDGTYLSVLINPKIRGARRGRRSWPPPPRSPRTLTPTPTRWEHARSWIRPRRIWCGSWSRTCPTGSATAPAS